MNIKKTLLTSLFLICLAHFLTHGAAATCFAEPAGTDEIKTAEAGLKNDTKEVSTVQPAAPAAVPEKKDETKNSAEAVETKSETLKSETGKAADKDKSTSEVSAAPSNKPIKNSQADTPVQDAAKSTTEAASKSNESSEKSTIKNYVSEKVTKDTNERIKNELKRLQSTIISAASGYNKAEHENSIKVLIYSIAEAVIDRYISSDEETDLAENLSTVIVALKVDKYEAKRIYRQFAKVLEEGDISNSVANKINDNSEKIVDIIKNKKEKTAEADGVIYKYYGLDGNGPKGVREKNSKDMKVKGYDTFFSGDNQKNSSATEDILKKYTSADQDTGGKKKKKIIGIELMSPNAAVPEKTTAADSGPDDNASIVPRADEAESGNKSGKGSKDSKNNSLDELFPDSKKAQ